MMAMSDEHVTQRCRVIIPNDLAGALALLRLHITSCPIEQQEFKEDDYEGAYISECLYYDPELIKTQVFERRQSADELTIFVSDLRLKSPALFYDKVGGFCCIDIRDFPVETKEISIAKWMAVCLLEFLRPGAAYLRFFDRYLDDSKKAISEITSQDQEILQGIENRSPVSYHIFITHGIRTYCFWADHARYIFKREFGFESTVARYGLVDLLTFLVKKTIRDKLAIDLLVTLRRIKRQDPESKLAVVIHSYGTMLTYRALELADRLGIPLEIEAVVLNGSILPQDCDWFKFLDREKNDRSVNVKRVLNVCGNEDIWPVVASKVVQGAGPSGAFFFSVDSREIENLRIPECGHSDMLSEKQVRELWAPFITGAGIRVEGEPIPPSRRQLMIDFYFWPLVVLSLSVVSVTGWFAIFALTYLWDIFYPLLQYQ